MFITNNLYYQNLCISKLFLDGVLTQYPVPKILISNIVDTNGAGDAFIGGKIAFLIKLYFIKSISFLISGFISKYVLGYSTEECVKSGINTGSYIIQQSGITKGDSFDI